MRIIITNTVALNGGDYAILDSLIKVLKITYGQDIKTIVYDSDPDVAKEYYPEIHFRSLIYKKYQVWGKSSLSRKLNARKLMLAARLMKIKLEFLARFILPKDLFDELKLYSSAQLIVSTGGTYLVENYDLSPRIFEFKLINALGKPFVLFTQSLGPFKQEFNKIQFREILDKASLILLRDNASYKNLQEIGVDTKKAKMCADVVFSDACSESLFASKSKTLRMKPSIGISVREWGYFNGRTKEHGMEMYKRSVARMCEYIALELGGTITFLSTCQGIKEYRYDDSATAEEIFEMLSEKARESTKVNKSFINPENLKSYLKEFDMVISTRMHFAIQSLAVGTPVLPIAYEFKTKELFAKLIDPNLILDIDTITATDALFVLKRFIETLPLTRSQLFEKVEVEKGSALMASKYLKEYLPSLN